MSISTGGTSGGDEYDGPVFPDPGGGGLGGPPGTTPDDPVNVDDYPISTWVVIDGVRAPCSTDELDIGQPTVLDGGPSFGWGRETIVDQPPTNTCGFTLREELDPRGDDVNRVVDPTFSDPERNAAQYPADWITDEGGEIAIGGPSTPEQVLVTNLLTDPSFEYGKGGFTNTQAEQDTTRFHSEVTSVKVTPTTGSATYDARCAFTAELGKSYTFTAWQWVPTGTTRSHNIATGQGVIPTVTYNDDTPLFDQWQRVILQTSIASSTGTAYVHLYGGDVIGQPVWYDDVTLVEGTVAAPDFNGDTPDTTDLAYRWTGEPGASSSQQYVPAVSGNADSYRVWLIGDRMASTSTNGPAGTAPDNGAMPVVPGQTFHFSVMITATVDREVRWQIATYDTDGVIINSRVYLDSDTPITANTPTLFEGDYTVPGDGTVGYIAVSFVAESYFGGTVYLSQPDIYSTGGSGTLDLIHVGSQVEVWSAAEVPVPDSEVMGSNRPWSGSDWDVSYYTTVSGSSVSNPLPVASVYNSGPAAWLIRPGVFDDYSTALAFAPQPFEADTDHPDAWDLIPKLLPGISWIVKARVYVPPLTTVTLGAWAYDGPMKDDLAGACTVADGEDNPSSVTGTIAQMQLPGAEGWYDLEAVITLPATLTDASGYWIAPGLIVETLPSPLTWAETPGTWADQTLRWIDLQRAGISTLSLLQAGDTTRTELVWSGEVTDIALQAAGDYAVTATITASDLASILSNVKVGDEPWPMETVAARAAKIMALIPTAPPLVIDDGLQDTVVSYRDVDSQAPLGLLQDLAQTCGGVLWITAHATQGAYLWMEDPRERSAVRRFVIDPDTGAVSITGQGGAIDGVAVISAMDILRDPATWTQDVSQVITQVSVSWMDQVPPSEQGEETTTEDHTEVIRDTQDMIDIYGIRDVSISTELTTAADARELGARILAMSRGTGWKVDGLTMDTILLLRDIDTVDYPARLNTVMDLLDATTRIGYAFTLIDTPIWTPAGAVRSMYVEGGTYSWDGRCWHLDITATPSTGQGVSARWMDFDGTGVTWNDFRPNKIRWLDAYGTEGPLITEPQEETADV